MTTAIVVVALEVTKSDFVMTITRKSTPETDVACMLGLFYRLFTRLAVKLLHKLSNEAIKRCSCTS